MKRISIIIPVHNAEKYLEKCIQSILPQITKEDEILLMNDSSTDNSKQICEKYASKYENVATYYGENGGPSKTRNIGIQTAKGNYFLFIDADDYLKEDYIEKMMQDIEKYQLKVCGYCFVYEETGKIKEQKYRADLGKEILAISKEDYIHLYSRQLLNLVWNKIYHAEIIRKYQIKFDESIVKGEDLLFNLDYIAHIESPIAIINESLYYYVSKKTGLNRAYRESIEARMLRTKMVYEKMKNISNKHKNKVIAEIINMYFIHLRNYQKEEMIKRPKNTWMKKLGRPEIYAMMQEIEKDGTPNLKYIKRAYEENQIYRMLLENKIRLLLTKER